MDILKVVKAKREPVQGRPARARKELVLIIYDTVWVHRIHERRDLVLDRGYPEGTIEVKAKYALVLVGPDDSNAIGQCFATRGHASEAEWAHDWHDLPTAMERLRARHADEPFPEEIDYVIDWPNYSYWQHLKSVSSSPRGRSSYRPISKKLVKADVGRKFMTPEKSGVIFFAKHPSKNKLL